MNGVHWSTGRPPTGWADCIPCRWLYPVVGVTADLDACRREYAAHVARHHTSPDQQSLFGETA